MRPFDLGWWALMAERQTGIDVRITGDKVPFQENVFVTSNHQSVADIMVMPALHGAVGASVT